jgi:DNA-binding transcriptional MerR regulator
VSDLCGVKPHVLRYWEQEFTQLKPVKRRGNRRYYQHHEVLLIRRIRELLYEEGFTISGARNRLDTARLDSGRIEAAPVVVDDKIEAPVRNGRGAPPNGVDVAAIKRELRAVLDQLQR